MRRRIGFSALGILLFAAAGLWAWRWDSGVTVRPDLSQPPPTAPSEAPTVAATPVAPGPAVPVASVAVASPSPSVTVVPPTLATNAPPVTVAPPTPATAVPSLAVAPTTTASPVAVAPPTPATAVPSVTVASPTPPPPVVAARPPAAPAAASFDVVRVNPQGNAVIAGRAMPNADVVAFDGNTVIGRATADRRGEWVILPEAALPPGPHTLRLDAPTPSDPRIATAPEEISIVVPAPGGAIAAAMPAVARSTAAPTAPRVVPDDPSTSTAAVQTTPAKDALAREALAQDKAAQLARDKNLVVRPGNSLWRIARTSYGAGRHFAIIYSANRDRIGDPDLIYPGQVFTLPEAN
jgi:LysM domain-containing protein